MKLLKYRVIREYADGSRGKRAKVLFRWSDQEQLHVGGLYVHLGAGYPGLQRVLSVEETKTVLDPKDEDKPISSEETSDKDAVLTTGKR